MAQQAAADETVTVRPTTTEQVFNLMNTVAKGILNLKIAEAHGKLTPAQAQTLANQAQLEARTMVQSRVQQGQGVEVKKSWLEKWGPSPTLAKWISPILLIGGAGLLGYAIYRAYGRRRPAAANPRRKKRCRNCGTNPCVC